MHACMAEIGILLTKEPGFHQVWMGTEIHGFNSAEKNSPNLLPNLLLKSDHFLPVCQHWIILR